MNIAQMLAYGPKLRSSAVSKTAHMKAFNLQKQQEQEDKVLAAFKGRQLTSKQLYEMLGYETPSNMSRQLRKMEKRGVLRIAGYTPAGHQLRSKIIWEEVNAVKS